MSLLVERSAWLCSNSFGLIEKYIEHIMLSQSKGPVLAGSGTGRNVADMRHIDAHI
jgi:hypothetical protein